MTAWASLSYASLLFLLLAFSGTGRMMTTPRPIDPRRYHEAADPNRSPIAPEPPVCL